MTAQPIETDTLIDIAALVGEMEAPACESLGHDMPSDSAVHGGEAAHYVRIFCPTCGHDAVKAYCQPFTAYLERVGVIRCSQCRVGYDTRGFWTILGPVGA